MMRLAEKQDASALALLCGDSLLGAYVLCRFGSYANDYGFAKCYVDCFNGQIVTALSILDGHAVLLTSEKTDFEELSMALPVLSVRTVMTDRFSADRMALSVLEQKQAFCYSGFSGPFSCVDDAPLREVYSLISRSIPGGFPDEKEAYLQFLSDFTFRRKRGFARLKAIVQNEKVCACALTAAESARAAVISGVACAEDCRGRGYGRAVVAALAGDLQKENKKVHVIALNDAACGFYRRIGFVETEAIIRLIVS